VAKCRPDGGYGFDEKKRYRRKLWDFIERAVRKPIKRRKVCIIDTAEANETLFLLKRGYSPGNIVVVNEESAELAWVTTRVRRAGYADVHTCTTDIRDTDGFVKWAYREGIADEPFDAVNLDLCGPMGRRLDDDGIDPWAQTVGGSSRRIVARGGVLAVTVLVGRDTNDEFRAQIDEANTTSVLHNGELLPGAYYLRVKRALGAMQGGIVRYDDGSTKACCYSHVIDCTFDWYPSTNGQRMLWVAAKLMPHFAENEDVYWQRVIRSHRDAARRFLQLMVPPCIEQASTLVGTAADLVGWVSVPRPMRGKQTGDRAAAAVGGALISADVEQQSNETMRV
jgi:hypothetical protein